MAKPEGGDRASADVDSDAGETSAAEAAVKTATTTAPAAGGGSAAVRALTTAGGDSEALRRGVGVEDRLAGLEARLRGMDNWN